MINYIYDALRFVRFSVYRRDLANMRASAARAYMLRSMHSLEKGLALPDPRPGFGQDKAMKLVREIATYRDLHGNDWTYRTSVAVLREYFQFQARHSINVRDSEEFEQTERPGYVHGGTRKVQRTDILKDSVIDFRSFTNIRFSIRNFTSVPIDEAVIRDAIDIARKTPSVCNRSSGRAYYTTDRSTIERALAVQDGAKGFGHNVPGLVVVASDLGSFYQVGERSQAWVDGGLFAMTLVYALHAAGYGTCMLNWSKSLITDRRFRQIFDISEEDSIIMMIAVGQLPEEFRVAASPRQELDSFAKPLRVRERV